MKIISSINIDSLPEVVFGWLENPEKARMWMTSVSGWEILHETPNRVGTRFREVVEDENGSIEMQGVITEYQSNKTIAFHLESKVNIVDVEYCVDNTGEKVRLECSTNIKWKFPVSIFSLFIGKKMKQSILAQLRGELNSLKELCEKRPSRADSWNHNIIL